MWSSKEKTRRMQRQRHNDLAVNRGEGGEEQKNMENKDKQVRKNSDGETKEEKGRGGSDRGLTTWGLDAGASILWGNKARCFIEI